MSRPLDVLASQLERVLLEQGPLPACELALAVHRRKLDVLERLHADRRFEQSGKRRASRWNVARPRTFKIREAAEHWHCDLETATEILFGEGGFLALGFVASVNGNGCLYVTERGLAVAHAVGALDPGVTT